MKLRVETSRLLVYRLGWMLDSGRPATPVEDALPPPPPPPPEGGSDPDGETPEQGREYTAFER